MKFVSKYISLILLLLCATVAEAQMFSSMQSQKMVSSTGITTAPTFQNSNSLLDRNITVRPMQQVSKQAGTSSYSAAPIYTGRHSSVQPVGAPKAASAITTTNGNIFGTTASTMGDKKEGLGGLGLFTEEALRDGGLDVGYGDYRPGEITPLGDAFVPLVLLLLCYCLFLLVRGDARKDQEEAA